MAREGFLLWALVFIFWLNTEDRRAQTLRTRLIWLQRDKNKAIARVTNLMIMSMSIKMSLRIF